jgi:penicillin-binding protein 2
VPDDAVKKALVDKKVLAKGEVPRLTVGDNVQVAIGQGLMAATPLQMADAYSTIANGGSRLQPSIIKAIWAPLTPDQSPAVADLTKGTVVQSFEAPVVKETLDMPKEVRDPIVDGLTRVIRGPGVRYGIYHATTGQYLFGKTFPVSIAGKTGTAQGAANLPWNDSSAFGSFSLDPKLPYTVISYLEKAGYGAKAAAPVTKCIWLALDHKVKTTPVFVSDPLDLNSVVAANDMTLPSTSCLNGAFGDVTRG